MAKNITLTLGQYLLMSEAHIKNLVAQGYSLSVADEISKQPTVSQPKVEQPKATKVAYTKPVSKANNTKQTSTKGATKPTKALAFGKVKVGDYFKVVVDKDGKQTTTRIGKADSIDKNDKIVWVKNGDDKKGFALEKCVPISKAEYGKLKKKLKVSEAKTKVSTSTKLAPKDYKVVYCYNLTKLGKITEEEFAKAKADDAVASELYKKFKDEVKLANSDAIKLLAENSAKPEQPQA